VQLHVVVSQDNFYRKLLKFVDIHFLYKETAKYYGTEEQESIDAIAFFKIYMIGYLNNITNYLGMKRIQARDIHTAVKHILMASLYHNLK
jgi:hypothetical protein